MLYRPIHAIDDYDHLQQDINKLCTWTSNNLLQYNSSKCKYTIISKRKQPLLPSTPLTVNDSQIDGVSSFKYLGVWLTATLNWSPHITNVCKKPRQHLGILHRKFYSHSNTSTLQQLCLMFSHILSTSPSLGPTSTRTY